MPRQFTSFALMVCGVLTLALGLNLAPAPARVAAAPALQPSPRPTLVPTAEILAEGDEDRPIAAVFGRITGTVVDARTGAPAAGRAVLVGDIVVVSDANGNYDRWVTAGSHTVALQLAAGEGVPAEGARRVDVAPDGTAVVHLYFSSPATVPHADPTPLALPTAPAAPTHEPTAVPAAEPVAEAPAAQPAAEAPAARPEAEEPAAQPAGGATSTRQPAQLPETALGGDISAGFLLVGAALFGAGVLLQRRPRRRAAAAAADRRMLRRLLSKAPAPTAEETLEGLLSADPGRGALPAHGDGGADGRPAEQPGGRLEGQVHAAVAAPHPAAELVVPVGAVQGDAADDVHGVGDVGDAPALAPGAAAHGL